VADVATGDGGLSMPPKRGLCVIPGDILGGLAPPFAVVVGGAVGGLCEGRGGEQFIGGIGCIGCDIGCGAKGEFVTPCSTPNVRRPE
jgi:hypothetical protein